MHDHIAATVAPRDPTADFDIHLNYHRVLVGLDGAISEIATEDRIPVSARRIILRLLLNGLPLDHRDQLVDRVTDLGNVWLRAATCEDAEEGVAEARWQELSALTETTALEVATINAAAVAAYQQHTAVTS